jgi:hypothetical protein
MDYTNSFRAEPRRGSPHASAMLAFSMLDSLHDSEEQNGPGLFIMWSSLLDFFQASWKTTLFSAWKRYHPFVDRSC